MAETQVLGWGTQSAPASRETTGSHAMELLAIDATFNGAAAAGSFVPAVKIISDAGEEVGAFPLGSSLAAGDSATVTFAPFLRGTQLVATNSACPIGFYNVAPNAGNPVAGGVAIGNLKFTFAGADAGTDLLDTTVHGTPTGPTVKKAGVYFIMARIGIAPNPPAAWPAGSYCQLDMFVQNEPIPEDFFSQQVTSTFPLDNSDFAPINSVSWTRFLDGTPQANNFGVIQFFQLAAGRPLATPVDVTGTVSVQKIF